ncbi:SUMF1/EgtB/PvdO family nonheme iron enzyme [Candidatus Latescibacterota bacterium]
MICRNCGKITPDDKEACEHCGAELNNIKKDSSAGETPPAPQGDAAQTQITQSQSAEKSASPPEDAARTQMTPTPPEDAEKTPISSAPSGDAGNTTISTGDGENQGASTSGAAPPDYSDEEAKLRSALSDRYEINKKLGAGGMATVYLAREIALERDVAIKVLPRAFTSDENFVARFKSEAQIAANLEHPHIVRIYQISEEQDLVYFVMSFIPGGSITDRIKKHGTIPVDDIVKWGIDISSALAHGHDKGVIHRDLKPDNLMIDKGDRIVVMDYGIARAGQGTGLTQEGSVIGTPQYMSPEQARGTELDARSDIYSMGIVLYQMATGDLPFQADDAASLMYMHVHETPEPPDARNANIPEWLKNIILKCLAKNQVDRFETFEELKAALSERYSPKLTITPLKEKDRKRKRKILAVAALVITIIIAASGIIYMQYSEKQKIAEEQRIESQEQARARQEQDSAKLKDDTAFQSAQMADTKQSYSIYLNNFPEGLHAADANSRIEAIDKEEAEQRETVAVIQKESDADRQARLAAAEAERIKTEAENLAREDDTAYNFAEMTNTTQSYTIYLGKYPNGRHVDEANTKLAALDADAAAKLKEEADAAAARDDQAFELARNADTQQAYNTYLMNYLNGLHSDEAKNRIAGFEREEKEAEKVRVALSALSLRMVKIPSGSFIMGSENGAGDEKPVRTLALSGFEMSSTEITQAQYESVVGKNPSNFKLDDNRPVERVNWNDAIAYCNMLSDKIGLEPCYNLSSGACDLSKSGFRLPTEAEWEYACRAESGLEYSLGDGESALDRAGWYQRNSRDNTHPVGQKTQNNWGLYDTHGNVWEWCNDWYDKAAYGSKETNDPTGPASGSDKVLRGGSWIDSPKDCRSAKRRNFDPGKDYSDIGFRIVRR